MTALSAIVTTPAAAYVPPPSPTSARLPRTLDASANVTKTF
jgi:hypothetical protein